MADWYQAALAARKTLMESPHALMRSRNYNGLILDFEEGH